jgi:hypothetical protein
MHGSKADLALKATVAVAVMTILVPSSRAQPSAPTPIAADGVATVGGVKVACTGIGQTRDDPRWAAYPVRIEVSDAKNQYLAGAIVQVSDKAGKPLLGVSCDDAWVLLKLKAGTYKVFTSLIGSSAKPRTATIHAPASGQVRVVMQFPDA